MKITYFKQNGIFWPGIVIISSIAQLILVAHYSVDVPWTDQFDYVPLLKDLSWRNLFSQHNEHRLIVPKLFFVFLAGVSRWNVRVETFFNWLFLQCSALLLYGILRKNVNRENTRIVFFLVCFFLTPQYYDDLLWGFQNCVQINLFAILGGFFICGLMKDSWPKIPCAMISCIIATFSGAAGLLTWPLLFFLLFERGGRGNPAGRQAGAGVGLRMLCWIFGAAAVMTVYFRDYDFRMVHTPTYPWAHPPEFLLYFFTFLGASWSADGGGIFAGFPYAHAFLGAGLTAMFIYGCAAGLFNLRQNVLKFYPAVFVFLLAAVTSFGRADFILKQAAEPRYRIYSVLLPIMMAGMLICGNGIGTKPGKAMLCVLICGMAFGIFSGWREGVSKGENWYLQRQFTRAALRSYDTLGRCDLEKLILYPDPLARIAVLKELRYSVFR